MKTVIFTISAIAALVCLTASDVNSVIGFF